MPVRRLCTPHTPPAARNPRAQTRRCAEHMATGAPLSPSSDDEASPPAPGVSAAVERAAHSRAPGPPAAAVAAMATMTDGQVPRQPRLPPASLGAPPPADSSEKPPERLSPLIAASERAAREAAVKVSRPLLNWSLRCAGDASTPRVSGSSSPAHRSPPDALRPAGRPVDARLPVVKPWSSDRLLRERESAGSTPSDGAAGGGEGGAGARLRELTEPARQKYNEPNTMASRLAIAFTTQFWRRYRKIESHVAAAEWAPATKEVEHLEAAASILGSDALASAASDAAAVLRAAQEEMRGTSPADKQTYANWVERPMKRLRDEGGRLVRPHSSRDLHGSVGLAADARPPPAPSQERDLSSIDAMVTMLGELLDCSSHLLPAQCQKPTA